MRIQKNIQIVKDFFAAMGGSDRQDLLALCSEDIEWIIPGEDWPLAGTHRGHAGLTDFLQKASETVETSFPEPPEYVAQGDRGLVVGVATSTVRVHCSRRPQERLDFPSGLLEGGHTCPQSWNIRPPKPCSSRPL